MSGDLTCTYCGGTLFVTMEVRAGHGMYDVPDAIECDRATCSAEWNVDGTLRTPPFGQSVAGGAA